MAINSVMFLLSLAFGGLGGYGFWAANANDKFGLLVSIVSGVMIFACLAGLTAVRSKNANGAVGNLRAISVVILIVSLVTNIIFSFFNFQNPAAYIIVNGIEILIFFFFGYGIFQSLK